MPFKNYLLQDALMRHTLDLPEREYYKVPFGVPKVPNPGYVLLTRRPMSPMFRVMWNGGQTVSIMGDDPQVLQKLARFGVTKERAEKSLQHIWNFSQAYVKLEPGFPDAPPVVMPKSVLAGRVAPSPMRPLPVSTDEA